MTGGISMFQLLEVAELIDVIDQKKIMGVWKDYVNG